MERKSLKLLILINTFLTILASNTNGLYNYLNMLVRKLKTTTREKKMHEHRLTYNR